MWIQYDRININPIIASVCKLIIKNRLKPIFKPQKCKKMMTNRWRNNKVVSLWLKETTPSAACVRQKINNYLEIGGNYQKIILILKTSQAWGLFSELKKKKNVHAPQLQKSWHFIIQNHFHNFKYKSTGATKQYYSIKKK